MARAAASPIGDMPPAHAEARYHDQLEPAALAVSLKQNSLRGSRGGSGISALHHAFLYGTFGAMEGSAAQVKANLGVAFGC
jgi:hypothetical protein